MRVLYETYFVDFVKLSAVTGRSTAWIETRARREGWVAPESCGADQDQEPRLRKLADRLICELEQMGDLEQEKGFDKARIESVSALTRTIEKLGDITRLSEVGKRKKAKQGAEIADALRKIDKRIVELAREYAAQLGAAESLAD